MNDVEDGSEVFKDGETDEKGRTIGVETVDSDEKRF